MPKITITIDDIDSREYPDDCADKPWTAWIQVVSDDGRVSEFADAGLGATVREAIEDAVSEIPGDHDDVWLRNSWNLPHGDDFVVVDGGLVQNDPKLPVFDLDALSSDTDALDEVIDLYQRMKDFGLGRIGAWKEPVEEFIMRNAEPHVVEDILG